MSTQQWLDLLTQLKAAGTQRVGLWGGEPLLRKDIGTLVDHCADLGLWTTVDTNGYLFPKRWPTLRRADHLMFSLDGRRDNHELNREPKSHAKVLRALRTAADQDFSFWTLTVLTRHNLGDVDYILSLAERLGFQAIFQVLHHTEAASGLGDPLLPPDHAYRTVLEELITAKKAGRPVVNSLSTLRHLRDWPSYKNPTSPERRGPPCLAGQLYCHVDAQGGLSPCSLVPGASPEGPAPNALEAGFQAAFDRLEPPPCQSCSATAFSEYNRLYGLRPDTVWEWLAALSK
jgi:MoaA/NifB/PqqE/SkfB family radical SAM enzyme